MKHITENDVLKHTWKCCIPHTLLIKENCEKFVTLNLIVLFYLVNTKHNKVADRIINCCDNADWDLCIARCRSFCKNKQ